MSTLTARMPDIRRIRAGVVVAAALGNRYVRATGVHLAVQALGVLVLWMLASSNDHELIGRLTAWDGQWYLAIAQHRYDGLDALKTDPDIPHAPMAFFPLFPMLVWLVGELPFVGLTAAALIVSGAAGMAAACGLMRLAENVDGRPLVGAILVALHAGAPMAITMSMAYTESLFIALAVWSLVGVLERKWLLAAACCVWAGLTRSTASVLITVVAVSALFAAWHNRDRDRPWAVGCVVTCPLGLLSYWAMVAIETGSVTGWHDLEADGWGMEFDFGVETAAWFWETLTTAPSVMYVGIAALLVVAAGLAIQSVRDRVPWQLVAYAVGVIVLVVGTGGLEMTKARLLLPAACVLLLPIATRLASRSRTSMVAGVAAVVIPGVWFSAYTLTIWEFTI